MPNHALQRPLFSSHFWDFLLRARFSSTLAGSVARTEWRALLPHCDVRHLSVAVL